MMKLKCLTITLAAFLIGCSGEADNKTEEQDKLTTVVDKEVKVIEHFDAKGCDLAIKFRAKPVSKNQVLKLDNKNSLEMNQFLASKSSSVGAKIATNMICQKLVGDKSYQATDEEFAGFIQQSLNGLKSAGAKNLKLELTGEASYVYQGNHPAKEYLISGELGGGKQIFHNLVLIDKNANTAYSISVSGFYKAGEEIKSEFVRVVESMTLNSTNS